MSLIRGTSLSGLPALVADLGGDPQALLASAGLDPDDVGRQDVFVPLPRVAMAVELAAAVTGAPDFGQRLARRQGIEILGPVGVAARTSDTVADALAIFEKFLAAYSPGLAVRLRPTADPARVFFEFAFVDRDLPPIAQSMELSLGVTLRVLRHLMGGDFRPLSVHLPHDPLGPVDDYRRNYTCRPVFAEPAAGFTLRATDVAQPLRPDRIAHDAVVEYLNAVTVREDSARQAVAMLTDQLLPTGNVTLETIAAHLNLHPKTLQRRLAVEDTTFAAVLDDVRRARAEKLLRGTRITLSHLARELGYAEQSVLTRSCRRWFGCSPTAFRQKCQK